MCLTYALGIISMHGIRRDILRELPCYALLSLHYSRFSITPPKCLAAANSGGLDSSSTNVEGALLTRFVAVGVSRGHQYLTIYLYYAAAKRIRYSDPTYLTSKSTAPR